MKTSIKYVIILLLISSCVESVNKKNVINKKILKSTINEYNLKNTNYENFYISNYKNNLIITKNGLKINIPKNCFGNLDSTRFVFLDCFSIQNIIEQGVSTLDKDFKVLETDGMFYLIALSNNNDTLQPKKDILIEMPNKTRKKNMKIFYGKRSINDIVFWDLTQINIENKKRRIEEENLNDEIILVADSNFGSTKISNENSTIVVSKNIKNVDLPNYIFNISKLGWINCDRYLEGDTDDLIVNIQKVDKGASFYLVLINYNSVIPPRNNVNGKIVFKNIPSKEPYTLVAIGMKDEDTYFNMVDYDNIKKEVNFPSLKKITKQELTDKLFGKFGKDIWNRPNV